MTNHHPSRSASRRIVFVRGDRITSQIVMRKRIYALFGFVFVMVFGWLSLTTFYVFFKDELLQAAVSERRQLVNYYEAEIDLLKDQLASTQAQHKADYANYASIMESLLAKQNVISARHEAIERLVERASQSVLTGTKLPEAEKLRPAPDPSTWGRPQVEASGGPFIAFGQNRKSSVPDETSKEVKTALKKKNLIGAFDAFRSSLYFEEDRQFEMLDTIEAAALDRSSSLLEVFNATRLKAPAQATRTLANANMNTFEAASNDPTAFQRRMQMVHEALQAYDAFETAINYVPLLEPVKATRISSGFGRRNDPFLGRLAFHSGIDYAAPTGTPVYAPANGVVGHADWKGGYGKLIEIDHGNGVVTRYGHLSRFNVVDGQKVRKGQLIGYVGSTGRSTGAHLHYETHVRGDAIDPRRFLNAAELLSEPAYTASTGKK